MLVLMVSASLEPPFCTCADIVTAREQERHRTEQRGSGYQPSRLLERGAEQADESGRVMVSTGAGLETELKEAMVCITVALYSRVCILFAESKSWLWWKVRLR